MQKTCSNCVNQHTMNCPNSVMCYNLKSKPSWIQKPMGVGYKTKAMYMDEFPEPTTKG